MRAHFDIPASPDTDDGGVLESKDGGNGQIAAHAGGDESHEQLQTRIMEFKSDSSKMAVLGEFIDEVLEKAEEEANKQQDNGDTSNSQQVCMYIQHVKRAAEGSQQLLFCVKICQRIHTHPHPCISYICGLC